MFSALLNNVAAAAQAVQQTSGLPPQVQPLRDHAAAFVSTIMPMLRTLSGQVSGFAQQASGASAMLRPRLEAWKAGDTAAHGAILAALQDLHTRAMTLLETDTADYTTLSRYRDQVLGDQRTVAQTVNELNARLAGLRSAAQSQRNELGDQQKRLAILRFIPFAWAIAELASLISSSKSLEQQISDVENQIAQLNGQAMQVNHAQGMVQGFSNQLQLLESSMQTLLNGISLAQGQTQQILQSVQGGQQGGPVLVEAYLLTLKSQADGLISYLNT
jgi:DNA repair exonuclease SbcCD ATPase subunit